MTTKLTCPRCGAADVHAADEKHYRCTQCGTTLRLLPLPGASTIHCPQCHATVLGDALFCHQCGASVQALSTILPCPACGQLMPTSSSFCPYCGTYVAQPKEEMPREKFRRRESSGCPACGRDVGPMAEVCPYCGVNIEAFLAPLRRQAMDNLARKDKEDQESKRLRQAPQSSPANRSFFAVALALSLLLLIGLTLLLFIIRGMGGL